MELPNYTKTKINNGSKVLYKKQDIKENILIIDYTRILRPSQTTLSKFYHKALRLNFIL